VQVVTVAIARQVICDSSPALDELFCCVCLPATWEAEVVDGVSIKETTEATSVVIEEG
uniref:Uncharacterized protein n=1 Tax=Electrophorus electricus TaxID=8005 RepID=A0A4W4G0F3_ELEEL